MIDEYGPQLGVVPGPLLILGIPLALGKSLFWGTFSLQFVPWWVEAWRQISQGSLPMWNPLNGMGAPLLANYQTAFLYPPNWLVLLCTAGWGAAGAAFGLTFLSMLHLIWAGLGMTFLLRSFGLGKLAQALGGLAFSLCGYLVGRLEFVSMTYVFAWMPWILLFAGKIESKRAVVFPTSLSISIGLMLLAGHAQLSWYILLLAGVWTAANAISHDLRRFAGRMFSFALACVAGAGLAAVQLVPTAEYLLSSQRSSAVGYADTVMYSFWPWRLITIFAPDFFGNPGQGTFWGYATYWEDASYIGMLPALLALATIGIFFGRKRAGDGNVGRSKLVFWWAVIVLSVVLALGSNTLLFPFLYRYVPTFSMFQAPARYLIWFELALVILSAYAVEHWRIPQGRGLYWLRLGTAGAFAVTIGAGLGWFLLGNVKATFIRATALAGMWALGTGGLTLLMPVFERKGWRKVWIGLVYVWVLADLVLAHVQLNPVIGLDFYAGISARASALAGSIGKQRVYISEENLQTIKFRRFMRFPDFRPLEDWRNLRETLLPNLNLIDGVSFANNFDPLVPSRYAGWLQAVEKIDSKTHNLWLQAAGVGALEVVDYGLPGLVRFDRIEAWPQFAFFGCAQPAEDGEEVIRRFQAAAADVPILILEQVEDVLPGCDGSARGKVTIMAEYPSVIDLEVENDAAGWVYAAVVNYPGWDIMVDGQEAGIIQANYLFMAAPVRPGKHSIRLQFHPRSFYFGLLLSILTGIVVVWVRRNSPILVVRRK